MLTSILLPVEYAHAECLMSHYLHTGYSKPKHNRSRSWSAANISRPSYADAKK